MEIIDLQVNGTLTIAINDDEGNFDQFILNYIVTAYSFDLKYVLNDSQHTQYLPSDNNIFINSVKDVGLLADLSYIISVDVVDAYLVYTDWNDQISEKIPLSKGNGHIRMPLGKDLIDDNAGNYTFLTEIHLLLLGKDEEEVIPVLKLQDNLIPSNIYLKVESDGILYNNSSSQNPYQYYLGTIPFKVVPYQGFADLSSMYTLKVYLNDEYYTEMILTDQKPSTLNITTELLGWNKMSLIMTRKGETFNKSYYFFTKNPLGNFNWYITQELNGVSYTTLPVISYQYKEGRDIYKHENVKNIPGTSKKLISKLSQETKSTIYTCPIESEKYQAYDFMFSVGINYNKLNDVNKAILQIASGSNYIILYQNKISIFNADYKIYLPKNEYHLITVYRRSVSSNNAQPLFEYDVYIDGVLEISTAAFSEFQETYNTIQLDPGLYDVNYLELSYFNHNTISDDNQFYKYNLNPQKEFLQYLNDEGILYHYYSYKLTFEPESIPEDFQDVFVYASQFYNDFYKNRVKVNQTIINNVSERLQVPNLLLEYTEERTSTLDWSSDGEAFMEWLENPYDIITNTSITEIQYPVKLQWSRGKEVVRPIETDPNMQFRISLQGTSTLLYTNKNLDLFTYSPDTENVYLYSPNYDSEDPTTFLPERRFTLKADVVDSSHSNNNSLGKFINTISTKFAGVRQVNSKYSSYIKNTIEGFPILLFIKNSYYINSTKDLPEEDYYYLGIYNFNLGRDSEYNLGYKDLRLLPDSIPSGFAVTKIPVNKSLQSGTTLNAQGYLPGFGVAEIRENRNYFDFSQSHPSFLFPLSEQDNDYMFGKLKSNSEEILKANLTTLVEKVSKASGYIFDSLGKNMLPDKSYEYGYKSENPQNLVTNYHKKLIREFINAASVLKDSGIEIKGESGDLVNAIIGVTGELNPAVDYKSLSEYYVICMAFGLVDSVMKNLNLKTWNQETFYTAFYDIDTALQKDNAGNDTNYIAFSDYWEAVEHTLGGSTFLDPAISYKDWFNKDVNGYDIPMTYLLALAKYSYQYIEDDQTIKDWYPNNIWARFRRKSLNIPGWDKPSNINNNHIGCLTTADSFIDGYFKNHLSKIPDVFFNLNYRKKYFVLDKNSGSGFVTEDFKKFSGKRIPSVRDWLTSRFHLLDLYFNLGTIPDNINKYDLENQKWESEANKAYKQPESFFIDATNEDIIILQDIFSSVGSNTKYSKNIEVKFNSEEYSPLCLSGETTARYLTKDGNTEYTLSLETAGKSLKLGGSGNWTYINSINSLLPDQGSFYINSDKLTTLFGTSGTCNGWNITLPALQDVSLTSPLYSGVLKFDSLSNLNTINISGTKLGLDVDNLNVTDINASNVSYADMLEVTNCDKLTNININGSVFKSIILTPLKQDVVFFSDSLYKRNNSGTWEKTSTNNPAKCNTLQITNANGNGVIFIENQQFLRNKIYEGLRTITLKGFKEIYIDGCNFLQEVYIEDPETVEKFTITNSSSQAPYLKVNSNENNVLNLQDFSKLSELYFYRTKKFTSVLAPSEVLLKPACFQETSIKYLKGDNLKLSQGAFSQSSFTLLQEEGGSLCSFDSFTTNLSNTFYGCAISKSTFDSFNNTYKELLKQVTNTMDMWSYVGSLKYTETELSEDYQTGKCRFDLSMYKNVTNAQSMFGGNNKTTCHPDIFNGFGSTSGVDISNFFGWANQTKVSIPVNWLKWIKDKVRNFNSSQKSVIYKVLQEGNMDQLVKFKPKDLLGSTKITSIENWNFDSGHTIDLQDGFEGFDNLTTISYSFCGCNAENIQYSQNNNTCGFLYNKKRIKNIIGSFGFNNYASLTVDLEYFLPWETLETNNKQFQYAQDWDEKNHVMEFKKVVQNVSNLQTIFQCLVRKYTAPSLAHVFKNCELVNFDGEMNFGSGYTNTTITSIPYLFSNLKSTSGISFDWDMFKILPNVKDLRHCFEAVHFRDMLPFNIFQKRVVENNGVTKYIKVDSTTPNVEVKLKTYKYRQDITNLSYCFANCEFDVPMFKMQNGQYDVNNINSPGVAWRDINNERLYYTSYYNSQSALAAEVKIDNSEFDDLEFEASYRSSVPNVIINYENPTSSDVYANFSLYNSSDYNNPFVSPDFFYGCSDLANVSYCFSGSTLQGYIPDHLFKNCKNATITHFIQNVLILPKKWKQVEDELGNVYDLSYYIGSNFINSTSLDNAFSFKLCLPGYVSQIQNGNQSVLQRDLHIFCFTDSFNRMLESARYMYPSTIKDPPVNCIFAVQHYDNDVLLAVMYDKNSETNQEELKNRIGFNLSQIYTNLSADNLINNLFMQFGYGRIFDVYTTLSSIKKRYNSDTSWVMQIGNSKGTFGISKNTLLPSAPSNNPGALFVYSIGWLKKGDEWSMDNDGDSIQVYKSQIDGYSDTFKTNYNNSRSNSGYELKFI